jgi:hypothetical protein
VRKEFDMRIGETEKAFRARYADEKMRVRIESKGPVALADVLDELDARDHGRQVSFGPWR